MIPIGTYTAEAQSGAFGESSNKKTPFVRVVFAIAEGEQMGQRISWDGYFTENTQARTIEALQFCGCDFPDNDLTNIAGINRNKVSIVVEHERYEKEGEEKIAAKVAWVNSLAGRISAEQQMDAAKLATFKQRMKGAVLVAKQKAPPVPPSNGSARAPAKEWDGTGADPNEIPF